MTKRFVAITAAAMYACLDAIGEKITKAGGHFEVTTHGREVVYELYHHAGHPALVRVYTSIAKGTSEVRACDSDAVRLVIGCYHEGGPFKPLGKSRKILRTAPNGLTEAARSKAFLDRLTETIREGYKMIASVPTCPDCGAPMALRRPKKGQSFNPFFGCIEYPQCKGSLSA